MALPPGSRLGAYEIVSAIGAGGMGEVYRAHDPRLGRDVAVKILPDALANDAERLARFTREARAVAALNHPHIVTIFSTEEANGIRFITMELIEGRTLDRMIPRGGIAVPELLDIATALADALAAAHQKQITHRDLKPENVMVSDAGRVKVLDFGLARSGVRNGGGRSVSARSVSAAMTGQQITQAGVVVGTPAYMSPEQVQGRPIDSRSDLFSLGIVMYEMASGEPPFRGASAAACMTSILRDDPRPLGDVRPDLPDGVAKIVMRCLEKSPQARLQSAQELLLELKAQRRAWERGESVIRSRATSEFTVAVAPFATSAGEGVTRELARYLSEDVAAALSRFPYFSVRKAGARFTVAGSLRCAGDAIRLAVSLTDLQANAPLWTETYDRLVKDRGVFDLADDLTACIVATIAEPSGALVRTIASASKDRAPEELSVDELVVRCHAGRQNARGDERAWLRTAIERALRAEPLHAGGWALLASVSTTPPETAAAAARAIELDVTCQAAWESMACVHFFARDRAALRMAAERAVSLNPLNMSTVTFVAMLLAHAGDWQRGIELVRRAMELNPQHPGWYHIPLFTDHYRRGELEEALMHAKRFNSPQVWTPLAAASAAAQLDRVADARAAIEDLRKNHPKYLDTQVVRRYWSRWLWDELLVDQLMEGFTRALALVVSEPVKRPSSSPSAVRAVSIAVLPFTDMSPAKDQEWFCDGIAEEILTALSQIKELVVAARTSAFSFRGRGDDLRAIGEKLHVTTVLEGSVRRAGDRLRITVRLSDVAKGYQIWSDRYERDMKDVFDLQDEIAKAVAERLRVDLAGDAQPRVIRHTENQEAYDLYLRGRHHWYARTKGSLLRARQLFEEATQKDPRYALPYVGLAELFSIQSLYGFEREDVAEPHVREAIDRAIAISDELPDAHRARGLYHLFFSWDLRAAARSFERGIELDPSSGLTHVWLAWPAWDGREGVAIAAARRAQELDPLNPYVHSLAGAVYDLYGRGEEGMRQFEKAFEIEPNYLVGLYLGGGVCSRIGRHEDALRMLGRAAEMTERAPYYASQYGWALARAGRTGEARAVLAELERRAAAGEYVQPLHRAIVLSALGDLNAAFAALEEARRARNCWIGSPRMPLFENFRADPRFAEHVRRLGAAESLD